MYGSDMRIGWSEKGVGINLGCVRLITKTVLLAHLRPTAFLKALIKRILTQLVSLVSGTGRQNKHLG